MAGNMIDFDKIAADARRNAGVIGAPSFNIGMGSYRRPVTASAVPYEEVPQEPEPLMGGEGGDMRSYVPNFDLSNAGPVSSVPSAHPVESPVQPQDQASGGVDEQQKAAVEQVAQNGTIEQLLEALKAMASMEPGGQGNPVFQLDAEYKQSSALGGIPGTVAQYPKAGGMTRETEYFF